MDGLNWFAYCGNEPIGRVDKTGQTWLDLVRFYFAAQDFFAAYGSIRSAEDMENLYGSTISKMGLKTLDNPFRFAYEAAMLYIPTLGLLKFAFFSDRGPTAIGKLIIAFRRAPTLSGGMLGGELYLISLVYQARIAWYIDNLEQ